MIDDERIKTPNEYADGLIEAMPGPHLGYVDFDYEAAGAYIRRACEEAVAADRSRRVAESDTYRDAADMLPKWIAAGLEADRDRLLARVKELEVAVAAVEQRMNALDAERCQRIEELETAQNDALVDNRRLQNAMAEAVVAEREATAQEVDSALCDCRFATGQAEEHAKWCPGRHAAEVVRARGAK